MKLKVNIADGKTKVLDTNKISDRDAEVYEALEKLYQVLHKYDMSGFARVALTKDQFVGMTAVGKNPKRAADDFDCLLSGVNEWLHHNTRGRLGIGPVDE